MMRRRIGNICMILGAALILAALSLFLWNKRENDLAGDAVDKILPQLISLASEKAAENAAEDTTESETLPNTYDTEMTEVEIDGYYYIGYVSIPALDLELPVMTDWSYDKLKISPCRYYGSVGTRDMVIAAHNYSKHFGNIKNLATGDEITFTDMDGNVTYYEVAEIDTLSPTAVEDMTDSGYALTLFTCTYGGRSRVTVRCKNYIE